MKKVVVAVIVIALAAVLWVHFSSNGGGGTTVPEGAKPGDVVVDGKTGETNVVVEVKTAVDGKEKTELALAPAGNRAVVRRPLEPEATRRLHNGPVEVTSVFEASGKAAEAAYGGRGSANYYYTTTVRALSKVESKDEDANGGIRVVERRTFLEARDTLALSNVDVGIDLSTLPIQQVREMADEVCIFGGALAACFGVGEAAANAVVAKAAVKEAFDALNSIDGASARGMLGYFGVEVPPNLDEFVSERVKELVEGNLAGVHTLMQSIKGKTFIITYSQDAKGKPLNVSFQHEDGAPISPSEWEILRTANAFLDQTVVPDKQRASRVGDKWTVWADEVQELFGLAGDGKVGDDEAEGKIRVERVPDQENGDWTLRIEPSEVTYRGDAGSGTLEVKDGTGLVDARTVSVKALQATAEGEMGMLDKQRHLLFFDFVKKTEGTADMRFTLAVEPASEP